jgi:3-isopropylmalate/(R)-2-methylmalate dehydratase small subunit
MEPIKTFTSRTLVIPGTDIDTDQIIPARFLTTTARLGLGRYCFADWRLRPHGSTDPACALNQTDAAACAVLVAGNNFGCGSSREHAPWALLDFGFRAVVSTQIADIFRSNAARNGLLPIVVDASTHAWLLANPGAEVTVSLEDCSLSARDGPRVQFPFDPFTRHCLMRGTDELGFILSHDAAIARYEESST